MPKTAEHKDYTPLAFEYRNEQVSIPFCTEYTELPLMIAKRVLPGLAMLEQITSSNHGSETGIALMSYSFEGDSSFDHNPEAAAILIQTLKSAGIDVADHPIKIDSLRPTRKDFLQFHLHEGADYYYLHEDLIEQMFVIGPIHAGKADTDVQFNCHKRWLSA